jgi:hypothetical protein
VELDPELGEVLGGADAVEDLRKRGQFFFEVDKPVSNIAEK